jgi:cardiolipin synthase (CMP-forming)
VSGFQRQIPNLITTVRILLVVPIAVALFHRQLLTTLLLFAVAAGSDALDGFLAKRYGWQSELGSILDPIADKLLLATMFVTLAVVNWVPLWIMAAAVARDAIIVGGAAAYRFFIGPLTAAPSMVSKINTLCQAAFVLAVVSRIEFQWPQAWVPVVLGALTFATIVVSGIDYVVTYGRRAAREARARSVRARPA